MNKISKFISAAAISLTAVAGTASAAELISNGDFEAGLSGWNTFGNTASVINIGGTHQNVAYLNDNNSTGLVGIYQDIYIPVAADSLSVSFDYYFGENDRSILLTDSFTAALTQIFALCFGICVPAPDISDVTWTEDSNGWVSFAADVDVVDNLIDYNPNGVLKFALNEVWAGLFHDKTDSFAKIDNVSITTNGGPGGNEVPEPGTLALLGAGLLGLGLARRRKAA